MNPADTSFAINNENPSDLRIRGKNSTRFTAALLAVGLPFLLFGLHSLLFRSWIVDDAGISYAYARSLAGGYGLVSQPGMPPVEGFSNFTWVVLLSPFFLVKLFDPILTPKILSLALILASFVVLYQILKRISKYPIAGTALVLTFLAIHPSFVIWTSSGLENPLTVFIIALLLLQILRLQDDDSSRMRLTAGAAVLSAICALTRPDGVVYAGILPAVLAMDYIKSKPDRRTILRQLAVYLGVFLLIFGGYLLFRYFYFGDLLPNTYYAKINRQPFGWVEKLVYLFTLTAVNYFILLVFVLMFAFLVLARKVNAEFRTVLLFLSAALLIYLVLPMDWMPELRFATPFVFLFYLSLYLTGERLYETIPSRKPALTGLVILTGLFLLISAQSFYARSTAFAEHPTVPFTMVQHRYADRFNALAEGLGVTQGSLLIPDLGGTLYYSDLRIYDLAGLTDRVIAKNAGIHPEIFYDYVFEELKPTFIHTHGIWALQADFYADPRFKQDYAVLNEAVDEELLTRKKLQFLSGDYVRREVISSHD